MNAMNSMQKSSTIWKPLQEKHNAKITKLACQQIFSLKKTQRRAALSDLRDADSIRAKVFHLFDLFQ